MTRNPESSRKNISRWAATYLISPVTLGAPTALLLMYLFPSAATSYKSLCQSITPNLLLLLLFKFNQAECSALNYLFWLVTLILLPFQIFLLRRSFAKHRIDLSLLEVAKENIKERRWKSASRKYFFGQIVLGFILVIAVPILPSEPLYINKLIIEAIALFLLTNWLFLHLFIVFIALMLGYFYISKKEL